MGLSPSEFEAIGSSDDAPGGPEPLIVGKVGVRLIKTGSRVSIARAHGLTMSSMLAVSHIT